MASSRRQSKAPALPTPSTRRMPRSLSRHKTQYFEMMGQYALYDEGWLLSTKVNRAPVGSLRRSQSRPAEQPGIPALQPEQGLQPDRGHRRAEPAEGQGDATRSSSPRRRNIRSFRWMPRWQRAWLQPRPNITAGRSGVRLYAADDRSAARRASPMLLNFFIHDHRRHRRAAGRRRRHDSDLRRTFCRLRLLPAQGQTGVPVEPGQPQAHQVGRPRGAHPLASTRSSSTSSTTVSVSAPLRSTT